MAYSRPLNMDFDPSWSESAECLTLDFGPFETVNRWVVFSWPLNCQLTQYSSLIANSQVEEDASL